MTDAAMTGTEHLIICLEILNDLASQFLGEPDAVINSIRRSGILVPPAPMLPRGETLDERDAVAAVRLDIASRRVASRDSVRVAIEVVQDVLRELSKSGPVSERALTS